MADLSRIYTLGQKQANDATAKMMDAIEKRSNLKGQVEALEKSLKAITSLPTKKQNS